MPLCSDSKRKVYIWFEKYIFMKLWKKLLMTGIVLGAIPMINSEKRGENSSGNLEKITAEYSLNELKDKPSFEYSQEELNRFDAWIDSTLMESARDSSNSIIVNKTEKTLYLIKNGKVDSEYAIDLGGLSFEDKQKEGDGRTPEGRYIVKEKIPTSLFNKAFLINYPNPEDKAKGKTGGAIEIHGRGGQGYNWTLGCMAPSDEDMDKLYPHIKKGSRVTIVRCTSRDLSP